MAASRARDSKSGWRDIISSPHFGEAVASIPFFNAYAPYYGILMAEKQRPLRFGR
ncbi:hypothetical protein GbCGDNIH2_7065 [Granulibacter bethesdensis]|uniref:Uncharacterized protein n=1 Tax=Granulibacter bethesdensis TaxID=364410 RepID=A0AAN0RFD2_9PROT|nr:hypothetical protein GbCGDNIH3_7238 [Granulibacter bethesdensis]AHJ68115.1 hypothetical protein GbCGDNIH2_7065 [Granulibacter bethesdensis]